MHNTTTTRRALLGAALAAPALIGRARAEPDFKTGADIAKAEAEGELLFYTHDGEAGASAVVEGFGKAFPKIKANYLRAQTGALYNKILSERSAGRFAVDAIQFSEIGTAIDFQKKGGFANYQSPAARRLQRRSTKARPRASGPGRASPSPASPTTPTA